MNERFLCLDKKSVVVLVVVNAIRIARMLLYPFRSVVIKLALQPLLLFSLL